MLELVSSRIGRRLATTVGIAMTALGIGGLLALTAQDRRLREESIEGILESMATSVASSFNAYDSRLGRHPIADLQAELSAPGHAVDLEVFDAEGKILWSLHASRLGTKVEPRILAALEPPRSGDAPRSPRSEVIWPLRKRAGCLPCHASSPDPMGGLHLTADQRNILGAQRRAETIASIATVLAVILLTTLILILLNRMILHPLARLTRVMAQVEEGDFFARAEVHANDEMGLLASSFNKLIAKITDLRVERIDAERELHDIKGELTLKKELAEKSQQLEATNLKLRERVDQLGFLYALGRELAGELDPDPLLERLGRLVQDALGVPEFVVLLVESSGLRATVAAAVGFATDAPSLKRPFRLEGSVSADAIGKREPIYVPDLATDPRTISYRDQSVRRGSLLCVPVIYQDRAIGTLNYVSPATDAFSLERQQLLIAVANQAALALANAQLFRQTLELSRTDGLTGIPNRRDLEARMQLEWSNRERYEGPLSLVMIDIDHFKHYNDEHGHQLGDEVLRRTAHLLRAQIRKTDAIGRYGGEEFLVILPRTEKEQALLVADKLRRSVEQADYEHGYLQPLGRITISCGVATAPHDAPTLAELLHAADDALFAAKDSGRNRVIGFGMTWNDTSDIVRRVSETGDLDLIGS
ncbi:MAG: diguanylate cyclase [Deltaproteobacteria bacterium]|nr:diguanylate cyclase [Deltaproteobacteria bacterium]